MRNFLFCAFIALAGSKAVAQSGAWNSFEAKASPTPEPTPYVDSIRDSSGDTRSSTQMGQVVNMLSAGMNFTQSYEEAGQCSSNRYSKCVMSAIHFGMGLLSVKQSNADGFTAGQAGGSFGSTDTGSSGGGDQYKNGGYDPDAVAKSEDMKKANKIIKEFSGTEVQPGKPFVFNPKTNTITTDKGKTLPLSAFSSPSAMAAAGISKNAIDAAMASQKEISAKAMKEASKYKVAGGEAGEESGGSGGGWGGGSKGAEGAAGYAGLGLGKSGLGIERDPAQLAGMQKNYNGEAIGVAGDNIFGMMTRRYKVKESQRSFYDESELLIGK